MLSMRKLPQKRMLDDDLKRTKSWFRRIWVTVVALVVAVVFTQWFLDAPFQMPAAATGKSQPEKDGTRQNNLVDNQLCVDCHQQSSVEWVNSNHAKAMQIPTDDTVLGNFRNARFTDEGKVSRFYRRNEQFLVQTQGADGRLKEFPVKYILGYQPLQQYLIEFPDGKLQALNIAWDSEQNKWFRLTPKENPKPGDPFHWTGSYQTANAMCIVCHTTGYNKGYNSDTKTYQSTWHSMGVTCQGCHGPGERHVNWAKDGAPDKTGGPTYAGFPKSLTSQATPTEKTQNCAPCHARRIALTKNPMPSAPFLDSFRPSLLQQGLYFADGQQREEVYIDGSYRQSKMFQRGVTCTNCHNPHTGKLVVQGNGLCMQCHSPSGNAAFPNAAGEYDHPNHHHHRAESSGAQCVNCHMPSRTYMGIQRRPDHSLRVPRPDLSPQTNSPNACNSCHTDKSTQWAADALGKWFGAKRTQKLHYGAVFNAYRNGHVQSIEPLLQLVTDAHQPNIVRATALAELAQNKTEGIAQRMEATLSADPEIRAAAAESLEGVQINQRIQALVPLLSDPIKAVRLAAAKSLSEVPSGSLDNPSNAILTRVLSEYLDAQGESADMPSAQLNMGAILLNQGKLTDAEDHFQEALRMDPQFAPARLNLAQLYARGGQLKGAEDLLKKGISENPGDGDFQYALGLLLAQDGRLSEAVRVLARAAKLQPTRARIHYNLGLASQHMKRFKAAEDSLRIAQRLDARDPAIAYALAVLYLQMGEKDKARQAALSLSSLSPTDPNLRALRNKLE